MLADMTDIRSLLQSKGVVNDGIGSSEWWEEIAKLGTPLLLEDEGLTRKVLFLWRDPQGDETASIAASVLLDVNSITDHHSWTPVCLQRQLGTDVWFGVLEVNSQWRGSYSFIPLERHQLPDVVRERGDDSLIAQRSWWVDVAKQQTFDPLNALPCVQSGWGVSSPLHMPDAPLELGWQEWDEGLLGTVKKDQIKIIDWNSLDLAKQRVCWLFSTATGDAPLVVLLDGERWAEPSGTLSVLQYLTDIKHIAPAHYLLISSLDPKTRWQELGCSYLFWSAVVHDLLPRVLDLMALNGQGVTERLVAGQSLGGLSSLYACTYFPQFFSQAISLSGSFWWPNKTLMQDSTVAASFDSLPEGSLAEQIMHNKVDVSQLKIYQNVGVGEGNMCRFNDATYQAIKRKGGNVKFELVHGGHDWLSWRSGLIKGLLFLIPATR